MTVSELQRITTLFVATEDRVRLAGLDAEGRRQVLWLTRRLLERLLPVLLGWLERQTPDADTPHAEVLQAFAQQAAQAELVPHAPVQPEEASCSWLVAEVDVVRDVRQVGLVFKGGKGEQAALHLVPQALRQWLGIVHEAYWAADWPLAVWPQWMEEGKAPGLRAPGVLH